jgi:hypothetical protein
MGWDITTIGCHHLDLGDVQTVARHLSEALDINIDYGYDREYLTRKRTTPFGGMTTTPGFL